VRQQAVTAVGPFWIMQPGPARLEAYRFVESEPSLWRWYGWSGTEPQRTEQADRHRLWELQTHLGLPADASKLPAAADFDQRRIAHNAALAQGRGADALRLALQQELAPPRARFEDGSELLGVRFRDGARPVLTLLFRAGDASPKRRQPRLRSQVVAGPRWSTTMADPTVREVGIPLAIPPASWKKGWLYAWRVAIRKRPGSEVFLLSFRSGRAPQARSLPVLRLP